MRMTRGVWFALGVSVWIGACGDGAFGDASPTRGPSQESDGAFAGSAAPPSTSTPGATNGSPATPRLDAGAAEPPPLPPEVETAVDLSLPQASENYVYAVNPNAGTVAVIDARTQAIKTIKTGSRPSYLRTLAGTDNAIVLNTGSNKASVIRSSGDEAKKNDLPVSPGANAIAVAPDGKHAVVYYNATYQSAGQAVGSYQDVAVLALSADGTEDRAISMTVGFRPRDVFFSSDGKQAFVITEDGVSVLDFAKLEKEGSGIARLVTFGGVDQKNLDVAVTPDGRFALARAENQSVLYLVELESAHVRSLDLSVLYSEATPPVPSEEDAGVVVPPAVEITDLDLVPSGDAALAVLRAQKAVLDIPLPGGFDDRSKVRIIRVPNEIIGSVTVAPDGHSALAYTTAVELERMVILDLQFDTPPRVVALRKPVLAVSITPDSETALITHKKAPGAANAPGLTPDEIIDRSYGYSLLRIATGDVKLQATLTKLGPVAMVPDQPLLFILFRDDMAKVKEVHRVALRSFLVEPIIQLENPPISIGTAQASRTVFVNLEHPDGRMTFIDWDQPLDKLKTVTGFELNSRIRD